MTPPDRAADGAARAASAATWLQESLRLGAVVGLAVGLFRARAGFDYSVVLGVTIVAESLLFWLGAGSAVALVGFLLDRLSATRLPDPWRTRLAAGFAIAPWLLVAGYELNRFLGIRPTQLVSSQALPANVGLVFLALLAALWLARQLQRTGLQRGGRQPRLGWIAALFLIALVAWGARAWTFRGGQSKTRADVLILLIDALRADHVGAYGYDRETTPTLDGLAADGVRFANTIAASTFTKSSIASLFTGRYPYEHGVYWGAETDASGIVRADVLAASEKTLAEHFRERGYLTEAWVQNSHLQEVFGFGQGFVHYRDQQGHAPRINRHVKRFLRGPGQRYPYFTYLHYIDLHDPYRPPETHRRLFGEPGDAYADVDLSQWGAYLEAVRAGEVPLDPQRLESYALLYDAQLKAIDDEIAGVIAELKRLGRYDETLIVVTSDHGDAFGEHGVISHSTAPYDELIRVPWLVKLPNQRFAGKVIDDQVSLVDLLPTLLDALGLGVDEISSGCSRWPEIRGVYRADGGAVYRADGGSAHSADGRSAHRADGRSAQRGNGCSTAVSEIAEREEEEATLGLRTSDHKYLRFHGGREEFYDLRLDAGEQSDLIGAGEESEELLRLRRHAYEILAARHLGATQVALDEATLQELRALGYVK